MPKRTADEELYPVEIIVKARRTSESLRSDSNNPKSAGFGFGWEYNIKWEGYTDAENTWEPLENLRGCRSHILKFWSDAGFDSLLTNVPGFEVHAEWLQAQLPHPYPRSPQDQRLPKEW
ncbi:hypothetical protein B0H13DRAFT_982386 [Mycena leptocephala]|nr:hypothetical protein B0H13DRAFT_982386 [Mycena leptocephala]